MNIGGAAQRSGISEHTVRYYERIGLLQPVRRTASGLRSFTARDLAWLEFLAKLRATRMPLKQMRRYAELVRQGDSTLAERRALLEAHEHRVRAEIARMNECLTAVDQKLKLYREMETGTRQGCCDRLARP